MSDWNPEPPGAVVQDLVIWGFLSLDDVIAGDFEVRVVRGRHRNVLLRTSEAALLIKRVDPCMVGGGEGLKREILFYQAALEEPLREDLGGRVLRALRYPTPHRADVVLCLPWIDDARSFFADATGLNAASFALGETLGALHATDQEIAGLDGEPRSGETPSEDAESRLIHGDVCADNVLRLGDDIRLVDWEAFRRGDPADDVGGALAMYARARISGVDPDLLRDAAASFWRGYLRKIRSRPHRIDFLRRLPQACAARLTADAEIAPPAEKGELLRFAEGVAAHSEPAMKDLFRIDSYTGRIL